MKKKGKPFNKNFDKARKLTVTLLENNPNMRATQVFNYLNEMLDETEVPSLQHIARNWVNKYKPEIILNWIQVKNITEQFSKIETEINTLKKMLNKYG
jgi:hypothetical protein